MNPASNKFDFSVYEAIMAVLVVIYILNCISGKSSNDKLANKWLKQCLPYLEKNYAHIGMTNEYQSNSNQILLKESYNNYKCYASGRGNVKFCQISIDVKIFIHPLLA